MQPHIIVNETCSTIRYLGRQALKDHWVTASVAVLIFSACLMIPPIFINAVFGASSNLISIMQNQMGYNATEIFVRTMETTGYTSIFSGIYTLLVTGPFTFGISLFFIALVRRQPNDYGQIFSGFSYYGKTLGLSILITLITMAFMIPAVVIVTLGIMVGSSGIAFLGMLALLLLIIPALMFSMCYYLIVDHREMSVTQSLRASRELMRGNMGKLFLLNLSFIGWLIVAALVDGVISSIFTIGNIYLITAIGSFIGQVGMFVVTAYMTATEVQFYDLLTGRLRLSEGHRLSGGY